MKVKILSMQRVVNYGSFMQAYALKKVVELLGHQVSFCDFKPGIPRHLGEKVKKVSTLDRLARVPYILSSPVTYLQERRFRRKLRACYESRAWEKLGIGPDLIYDYASDVMIIGSDEVFNYTQNHAFGYVPVLFGHDIQAKSLISYAASAGYALVGDVEADGMEKEISTGFARFDYMSVRDQNTFDMVAKYSTKPPTFVIDPTLLYDFEKEVPASTSIKSDYLLVYAYGGRSDEPEEVKKILNFARSKALKVIAIGFYHDWCDENLVVAPFELLSVFRDASYVLTDTFHGTIFSIKNRKQFVSLIRGENRWGSNSSKLGFLLHQLNLEGRINQDLGKLEEHMNEPIDYEQVNLKLGQLRETSLKFLTVALQSAEAKLGGTS